MRGSRRLVIGLAAVLTVLAGACGGSNAADSASDGAPEVVVAADDGSATLTVPLAALPPGVAAGDLTVTRVSADELGDDDDAVVYLLEPDGTALGEGATLSTSIDASDGYLPVVLQIGGGDMEVAGSDEPFALAVDHLDGVRITYDVDTGMAEVTAPVAHFSSVIITRSVAEYAFFKTTWRPGRAPIGQMPPATLTIERNSTLRTSGDYPGVDSWSVHISDLTGKPRWFYLPVQTHTHYKENDGKKGTISLRFTLVDDSAHLHGSYQPGFDTEVLTPVAEVADRPPSIPLRDRYTIPNTDFTCAAEGHGKIHYTVELWWEEVVELQRAWDPTWRDLRRPRKSVFLEVLGTVRCDPAEATDTTTSTTRADATASTVASTSGTVGLGDATYVVTVPSQVEEGGDLDFRVCAHDTTTGDPLAGTIGYFTLGRDPGGPDASHASGTLDADGCFSGSVPVNETPGPTGAHTSNGSEAARAAEVEIVPAGG